MGALIGALAGNALAHLFADAGYSVPAFVVVGMAGVFAGAARTPISTLIMVAEMTAGYGLIVPTMLTVVVAFEVQRALTAGARYPTLYESQVLNSYHSPAHQGVLVRRAFQLLDLGAVAKEEIPLPRLVSLLQLGEPIPFGAGEAALVRVLVNEGGEFAGKTIRESVGTMDGVTAVAIVRQGKVLMPRGPTRLEPGDELVAVADRRAHQELLARA